MVDDDRRRWDARYLADADARTDAASPAPAAEFERYRSEFPTAGTALELACGIGAAAVWLALRGLDVLAVDVSPVAVARAGELARRHRVVGHCRFAVADLDAGLPAGPPADVVYCTRFRDARLDRALLDRLAPGGLLAVSALSVVGGRPGAVRAAPGELAAAFAGLQQIAQGEGDGLAWLLARRGR